MTRVIQTLNFLKTLSS